VTTPGGLSALADGTVKTRSGRSTSAAGRAQRALRPPLGGAGAGASLCRERDTSSVALRNDTNRLYRDGAL